MRRIHLVFFCLLVVIATVLSHPEDGKGIIYIDINSPQIRKFYLAVPAITDLGGLPQGMRQEVEETLTQDLIISDLFYLMKRQQHLKYRSFVKFAFKLDPTALDLYHHLGYGKP